jgi:broad specificity phosphatase PhoE
MIGMGVIYLVRHGQAGHDENGYGSLTDLGREQARNVGRHLARRTGSLSFAASGNLARQLETVQEIVGQFEPGAAPEPIVNAGWNEYDLTHLTSREMPPVGTSTEAATAQRDFQRDLDKALLDWAADDHSTGAGSYTAYRESIRQAITEIAAHAGPGQVALAASSAGTIGAVIAELWGVDSQTWPMISRTMVNASITKLIVGSTGINVMSVNDHAHADVADAKGGRPLLTMR